MVMIKRIPMIILVFLLAFSTTAWSANIPAKVFESGKDNTPLPVSGVKVDVFGGNGYKVLLSSTESANDGGCLLRNITFGKDTLVRLKKSGYITQYDIRSYADTDIEKGAILWIGSEDNIKEFYNSLGETFNTGKGHVYLEIVDENTGEGIEGVQLGASSGKVFDLGDGEYLIANGEGTSLKIGIQKPGYAFDIESATIPLFAGAITQYYLKVQSGGAVIVSGLASAVSRASISGYIKRLSDAVPLSGVSVAFMNFKKQSVRPAVTTDETGFYRQDDFPVRKFVKVVPTQAPWKFKPKSKWVFVKPTGNVVNFKAK